MVLLRKSIIVVETEEEELAESQETELKCWQEPAMTILSPDVISGISVCICAELGQLNAACQQPLAETGQWNSPCFPALSA